MGTWSCEAFGNDNAADWAFGLEEAEDLSYVEKTLDTVLKAEGYLDASAAQEALAAIEVIARLQGSGGKKDAYSKPADEWVAKHKTPPSPALVQKAQLAIARMLEADSELSDVWHEAGEYNDWLAAVNGLKARVK